MAVTLCRVIEVGVPGVTHTGVNTVTVILAKNEQMNAGRLEYVSNLIRQVEKGLRERRYAGLRKVTDVKALSAATGLQMQEVTHFSIAFAFVFLN